MTGIGDRSRCLSDASGDDIIVVERWQAIIFQPGYVACESKDAECASLRGLDSSASCGQWLNWDSKRWTWAWAVNSLSVHVFIIRGRCSIPICVALFRMEDRPRHVTFRAFVRPRWGSWGRGLGLVSLLC